MVEWTAEPADDVSQASSMPDRTLPSGPPGKIREYWVCLVLAFVTLGLYGLWYHWVMHRELCDYLGRPVREKPIWIAYLVVYLGMYVVIGLLAVTAGIGLAGTDGVFEEISGVLAGILLLAGFFLAGAVATIVLFIVYVLRQFKVLAEAKQAFGLPPGSAVNRFLGLYLGGVAASMFVGFIGLVLQVVAYWFMHDEYTEFWQHVRSLNIEKGYVGVGAELPGTEA